MRSFTRARWLTAALMLLFARSALAETLTIDLPTAIARAKERAPAAVQATFRVATAEVERDAAATYSQQPAVEVGAGPRLADPRTLAISARIEHQLEPGRRGARERVGDAGIARAKAAQAADLRALSVQVADAFYAARHAELVVELAQRGRDLAVRTVEAAQRRRKVGDITDLDVDLAVIAAGRAASALAAAQGERAEKIGVLATLIGAGRHDDIVLAGDLRTSAPAGSTQLRPDLATLDAVAAEGESEMALARANGRPALGLWAGYEREEGDSIVLGGLSFTLPVTGRADAEESVARAKKKRARAERDALARSALREMRDAGDTLAKAREAVEIFERDVLPALADSEQLLEKSIASGQLAISDYLQVRQEILSGRREHLDRLLALAKANARAAFVSGEVR